MSLKTDFLFIILHFFRLHLIISIIQVPFDQCTLYLDRNLINRWNVVEEVKTKFSACKQFFNMEIEA